MITTIIFDYYGVFQVDPYARWLNANGLKREAIYDDLAKQLDHGMIDRREFLQALSETVNRTVTFDEIYAASSSIDPSLVDIASTLKSKYQISLLSNASSALRGKLDEEGLIPLFSDIVISSEIGVGKPDIEIFEIALQRLGAKAEQVVFIDDNPHNIEASSSIGIKSILYKDSSSLKEELEKLNLF